MEEVSCKELLKSCKGNIDLFLETHKHPWLEYMHKPCEIQKMCIEKRTQRKKLFQDDYIEIVVYFQKLLQICFNEKRSISFKVTRFSLGYDGDFYTVQTEARMHTLEFIPSDFVGFVSHHDSSTIWHCLFYNHHLSNCTTPNISDHFFPYKIDYDGKINLDTSDLKIMIEDHAELHDRGEFYHGYGFLISKFDIFNIKIN